MGSPRSFSKLFRAWGKVRDQAALIFFDPGANFHCEGKFHSPDLAARLGIELEEMGSMDEARMAAPGLGVPITPIIGKPRIHVQNYVDLEDFFIMPLEGCDVLLGMPWFHRLKASAQFYDKKIAFTHRNRDIVLDVKLKGDSVPLVSASAISKVIKHHNFAYLVFAKEREEVCESNLSTVDGERLLFLKQFKDCFSEALPGFLPPERTEDHPSVA